MSGASVRGLASNALYTVWSAVLAIATVPVLIRTLGLEAYGIVGLLLSLQALVFALDLGLSAAMNRFVARYRALDDLPAARDLVASATPLYAGLALLTLLAAGLSAHWIAHGWLAVEHMPLAAVTRSMVLIGAIIAVRFWLTMYQSALIGAGRVDISSQVGLVLVTAAQLGGALSAVLTGDVQVYLLWLLVCATVQCGLLRHYTWSVLDHGSRPKRDIGALGRVVPFAAGMAGVSITGMILMQSDRIVLSRAVPLEEFAAYALCWTLATGLYTIMTPTFNFIAPRFASTVAVMDVPRLREEYQHATRVFAALLGPVAVAGALGASDLLVLFSGDPEVARTMRVPLALLLAGTALNGVMHFPYALQLAHGRSRMALAINVGLCLLFVPMLLVLVEAHAARGAAISWLLVNAAYVLLGLWATHRYLDGAPSPGRWLLRDVAPGVLLGVAALVPVAALLSVAQIGPLAFLLVLGAATVLCCLLALRLSAGFTLTELRRLLAPRPAGQLSGER